MMEEVAQPQEKAAVEDIEEEDTGMFVCIFILHHLMSVISVGSQTIDVITQSIGSQTAGVIRESVGSQTENIRSTTTISTQTEIVEKSITPEAQRLYLSLEFLREISNTTQVIYKVVTIKTFYNFINLGLIGVFLKDC